MSSHPPFYSRRLFLTRGVQLLSAAGTLPLFLDRSARCLAADFAANPQGAGRPDRVLVLVQLAGGNDGLNTVVPFRNDDYYRARPRLGIPKDSVLKADGDFGFHPSADGFQEAVRRRADGGPARGRLSQPQPLALPQHRHLADRRAGDGRQVRLAGPVLRRLLRRRRPGARRAGRCRAAGARPAKVAKAAEPDAGIALTGEPPTGMVGEKFIPLVFRSPEALTHRESSRDARLRSVFERLNNVRRCTTRSTTPTTDPASAAGQMSAGGAAGEGPHPAGHQRLGRGRRRRRRWPGGRRRRFLERSALNARVYADTIKRSVATVQNKAAYPKAGFATDLKLVAQMIASGLPTRRLLRPARRVRHALPAATAAPEADGGAGRRHGRLRGRPQGAGPTRPHDGDDVQRVRPARHGERLRRHRPRRGRPAIRLRQRRQARLPRQAAGTGRRRSCTAATCRTRSTSASIYATVLNKWLRADDAKVLGKQFPYLDLFGRTA